jgi:hypothetical protein
MRELSRLGRLIVCLVVVAGCAASTETKAPPSTAPAATAPAPAQPAAQPTSQPAAARSAAPAAAQPAPSTSAVALREEKGIGQVWLAPGFTFKGYDTLLITETRAEVPKLHPDGAANLEWARGVLRSELAGALQERKLFTVVTSASEVKPGNRVLRLDNTIIEYEKGGGGARFFGFGSGAGQPVIKVRGQLAAADGRPLFVYEARRQGDSAAARMFGGYRSDKDIQSDDIKDLAKNLGDFVVKTKGP